MRFFTTITSILLAGTALAAPSTDLRRERHRKRGVERQTNPPVSVDGSPLVLSNTSRAEYSSNWAGAVLIGSGYTSVTGSIIVPTAKTPPGGSSRTEYSSSAWVGIDGDTCGSAILQTGVDFYVQGSTIGYDAWYEWYPDYAYYFDGISISAGDKITMTVTASSLTGGKATIENETTGQTVSHTFTNQSGRLCETNAEWIVEDFDSNNEQVPFADFGKVTFTGASAKKGSQTVGVNGATILDIKQGNDVLTSCSTSGSSTVECSYV